MQLSQLSRRPPPKTHKFILECTGYIINTASPTGYTETPMLLDVYANCETAAAHDAERDIHQNDGQYYQVATIRIDRITRLNSLR